LVNISKIHRLSGYLFSIFMLMANEPKGYGAPFAKETARREYRIIMQKAHKMP